MVEKSSRLKSARIHTTEDNPDNPEAVIDAAEAIATAEAAGPNPFTLDSIRAKPDYGIVTAQKMPGGVSIGRPDQKDYIRVHPDCHIDLPLVTTRNGARTI